LDLGHGEVLGLGGLEGHGQVAFLRCLAGWERPHAGEVEATDADGRARAVRTARGALRNGISYVPGDRKAEGIFAALPVLDNLTLPNLGRYTTAGLLSLRRERKAAQQSVEQLQVRTPGLNVPIESLSGGNQQKVVLGRWIATRPRVLLLEDPMRGVDVTSKAEIMAALTDLVADGVSLVLLSTEVEELVDFCNRVAVFRDQNLSSVIPRAELTEQAVVSAMLGAGENR
jgi:ribose transport system ATP-binding protein